MNEFRPDKTFDKMVDLGLLIRSNKGIRFSPDWQKLIYKSIQTSAKKWHDTGRNGGINIFDEIEKLVAKKLPKLDPLLEVEISYYITEISKDLFLKWEKKK